MSQIVGSLKSVKLAELAPVIQCFLIDNKDVRITVTGGSMYPFLRELTDSVVFTSKESALFRTGDIVLYKRDNDQFVLHRIVKIKGEGLFIVGDAQTAIEGPVRLEQVTAVVCGVYRGDRFISCDGFWWRVLSHLWIWVRPFRRFIIAWYSFVRKVELRCAAFLKSIGRN